MQHPTAEVEVLVDDKDVRPEVTRADGRGQPGASSPGDHHVGLVVPHDVLRGDRCFLCPGRAHVRHEARADAGGGARPDKIAPAKTLSGLKLGILWPGIALLCHVFLPVAGPVPSPAIAKC